MLQEDTFINRRLEDCNFNSPSPQGCRHLKRMSPDWKIYRTRFLVQTKQLTERLMFVDALGREHCGQAGDYLVESSDGSRRIAPQEIFEDIYLAMRPAAETWQASSGPVPPSTTKSRVSFQSVVTASPGSAGLWKSGGRK